VHSFERKETIIPLFLYPTVKVTHTYHKKYLSPLHFYISRLGIFVPSLEIFVPSLGIFIPRLGI
jgi:hypothetical protein